jgi:hypothetical protein
MRTARRVVFRVVMSYTVLSNVAGMTPPMSPE